jgi:ribonuclease Z
MRLLTEPLPARGAGTKPALALRLLALLSTAPPAAAPAAPPAAPPPPPPLPPAASRLPPGSLLSADANFAARLTGAAAAAHNSSAEGRYSGLELEFLGTSSGTPTPWRNVSSLGMRVGSDTWLFDAGEATQHRLLASATLSYARVRRIFITHCHGDHLFGLPGVLASISGARSAALKGRLSNAEAAMEDAVHVYGPPGVGAFLAGALRWSATLLRVPVVVHELSDGTATGAGAVAAAAVPAPPRGASAWVSVVREAPTQPGRVPSWREGADGWAAATLPAWLLLDNDTSAAAAAPLTVWAAPLRHRVPCVGYVVAESASPGRIDADAVTARGIAPSRAYALLKAGQSVLAPDGSTIEPRDVVLPPRPGRKLVILGDTCDSRGIAAYARHADVLVHEATFQNALAHLAARAGHSTAGQAGAFAAAIGAKQLCLTHFSSRYPAIATGAEAEAAALAAAEGLLSPEEASSAADVASRDSAAMAMLVREAASAMRAPVSAVLAAHDFMRCVRHGCTHGCMLALFSSSHACLLFVCAAVCRCRARRRMRGWRARRKRTKLCSAPAGWARAATPARHAAPP